MSDVVKPINQYHKEQLYALLKIKTLEQIDTWEQIDMLYPEFRDYYKGLQDDRKCKLEIERSVDIQRDITHLKWLKNRLIEIYKEPEGSDFIIAIDRIVSNYLKVYNQLKGRRGNEET